MIGAKIKQARILAKMTLDGVAVAAKEFGVKLSKQAISNYEKGLRSPSANIIRVLARILKVKPKFFLLEPQADLTWCAYRSHSGLSKKDQSFIQSYSALKIEPYIYLNNLLQPEQARVLPDKIKVKSLDEAEEAAIKLRDYWELGSAPVDSMTQLLEDKGVIVIKINKLVKKYDGLSGYANQNPVISVKSDVSDDRLRLTLAHELGHLVMDCSSVSDKEEESFANRFAGAFLAPKEIIISFLGKVRKRIGWGELGILKKKYGISLGAALYRIKDLGILNDRKVKNYWIQMSAKGWRKDEPYEYVGNEESFKLKAMTLHALSEDLISEEEAEELCHECIKSKLHQEGTLDRIRASDLYKMRKSERMNHIAVNTSTLDQNSDVTNFVGELIKDD